MKKATIAAAFAMAALVLAGCQNKKPTADADGQDTTKVESAASDTTVYGTCLEGSNHRIIIKTDDGRVMGFTKDVDDSVSVVYGGVLIDDEMAITYYINKVDYDTVATRVINLTTLRAHWRSLDRDFEFEKGGTVKSNVQNESHPWATWRILNGRLLLGKDTFDITMLSADSLYLENNEGIYTYKRVK